MVYYVKNQIPVKSIKNFLSQISSFGALNLRFIFTVQLLCEFTASCTLVRNNSISATPPFQKNTRRSVLLETSIPTCAAFRRSRMRAHAHLCGTERSRASLASGKEAIDPKELFRPRCHSRRDDRECVYEAENI